MTEQDDDDRELRDLVDRIFEDAADPVARALEELPELTRRINGPGMRLTDAAGREHKIGWTGAPGETYRLQETADGELVAEPTDTEEDR